LSEDPIIIDAADSILGRLASYAAKRALEGYRIIILNAEKAIISGNKRNIIQEAKDKLGTRTLGSQKKAPIHPRRPDLYVRRVIRGMLPRKKTKGLEAFSRITVFINVPEKYVNENIIKVPEADVSRIKHKYITVGDLSKEIGGL
jgi:large subunit ribosomal protein L13